MNISGIYPELSSIKIDSHLNVAICPAYFLEDYFIDFLEEKDYQVQKGILVIKNHTIQQLNFWRVIAYYANNWYEELKDFTIPSTLYKLSSTELEQEIRSLNIEFPKFVKLDSYSAKDTGHNGIFQNCDQLIQVFKQSSRILDTLKRNEENYLFVRQVFKDKYECRCFIYNKRLTAISIYNPEKLDIENKQQIKTKLAAKIQEFMTLIPYNDVIVDMYYPSCTIIELNSFGADMPCGSDNFDWSEDYVQLHGGFKEIEIR